MKTDFWKRTYLFKETMTIASMQVFVPLALSPVALVFPEQEEREKVTTTTDFGLVGFACLSLKVMEIESEI